MAFKQYFKFQHLCTLTVRCGQYSGIHSCSIMTTGSSFSHTLDFSNSFLSSDSKSIRHLSSISTRRVLLHGESSVPNKKATVTSGIFSMNNYRHSKEQSPIRTMGSTTFSKFMEDIDIDQLKKDILKENRESSSNVHLATRIKEIFAERCAQTIANYNEEEKKRLRVLQLEHSFLYSEGYDVPEPERITDTMWVEAMSFKAKSQRLNYYLYNQSLTYKKAASLEKKAAIREETKAKWQGHEHGVIFMRIYDKTMTRWLDFHLASALIWGNPLILDMGFGDYMRPQEQKNTAKQLHDVYTINRADVNREPFHLHFTGWQESSPLYRFLQIKKQEGGDFLATFTEKSYLDLFDKNKLVYLSPNGREVMKEFDHDAVYIIGAFNDKVMQKPVTYARATEQGIKCQRLPLDEHLRWGQGTKSLTLDQVMKIMVDKKNGLSWKEAFRHIPSRKVYQPS